MKHILKPLAFSAVLALASTLSSQAQSLLVNYNLGGTQQVGFSESNLSNTNSSWAGGTMVMGSMVNRYLDFSEGRLQVGGDAYAALQGLYKWNGVDPYSLTATSSFSFDAMTVVFQVQGAPDGGVLPTPTLSFNGGSQNLLPDWGGATTYGEAVSGGGMSGASYNFSYQWNLAGLVDDINSISIFSEIPIHTSTSGVALQISDGVNTQALFSVVPEPSTYAMIAVGVGALLVHGRRRRSAKVS